MMALHCVSQRHNKENKHNKEKSAIGLRDKNPSIKQSLSKKTKCDAYTMAYYLRTHLSTSRPSIHFII
ncbi:hypothetical protein Sjap_011116 [Stephania japonica]|uniref:Uncharacterized protein n=1 Tax=Stephania japonica TaxID=461633 RepID=A0AAP0P579_9MAGN